MPTLAHLLNGSSVLVSHAGSEPINHGNYEDSAKALLFAAAAQLSTMGGQLRSKISGNTGFLKVDLTLTRVIHLFARLNTSCYFLNTAGQFVAISNRSGIKYFPASYQEKTSFLRAPAAYVPRQIQFALKLIF